MTTITIPEAVLSQIKPGERAVEVRDAAGRTRPWPGLQFAS